MSGLSAVCQCYYFCVNSRWPQQVPQYTSCLAGKVFTSNLVLSCQILGILGRNGVQAHVVYIIRNIEQKLVDLACWAWAFAHHVCSFVILFCVLGLRVWAWNLNLFTLEYCLLFILFCFVHLCTQWWKLFSRCVSWYAGMLSSGQFDSLIVISMAVARGIGCQ